MTSAPFRDLFVELPRAVFDVLHAWGEAVIVKAQQPAATTPPVPLSKFSVGQSMMLHPRLGLVLRERYGWSLDTTIVRSEREAQFEVRATLSCGHRQRYVVDERAVLLANDPGDVVALLDYAVDNTPRDCYCVMREP